MHKGVIWVVVPTARPENVEHVLANFWRQSYPLKRLMVVENGSGAWDDVAIATVLRNVQHHSTAKNYALDWLDMNADQGDFVAIMDDDDFYGEEFLTEHAELAEPGVIQGKVHGWVQFNSGLEFFGHTWKAGDRIAGSFLGGTMGFFLKDAARFPVQVGEELGFCIDARSAGCKTLLTSPLHYCYSRLGDRTTHTDKALDKGIRRLAGSGIKVEGEPLDWLHRIPEEMVA
jgi:hypothetical protein